MTVPRARPFRWPPTRPSEQCGHQTSARPSSAYVMDRPRVSEMNHSQSHGSQQVIGPGARLQVAERASSRTTGVRRSSIPTACLVSTTSLTRAGRRPNDRACLTMSNIHVEAYNASCSGTASSRCRAQLSAGSAVAIAAHRRDIPVAAPVLRDEPLVHASNIATHKSSGRHVQASLAAAAAIAAGIICAVAKRDPTEAKLDCA